MYIKLTEPNKLLRTTDCFVHRGKICYDISKKAKNLEEYLNNLASHVIIIYEPSDYEVLDFSKYYKVELIKTYGPNELTSMELIEQKNDFFKIIIGDYDLSFIGLRDRAYYELYDDDFNLLPLFSDKK